jgi:hypothetical protein
MPPSRIHRRFQDRTRLRWPELQIDAAELAMRVVRGPDETSEPPTTDATTHGWTEKHTPVCFSVHP